MTRHRPKKIYICGGDDEGEVVADPCDVCQKGIVRRHRIVGNYTGHVCSNDECPVNGTPQEPTKLENPFNSIPPMPVSHSRVPPDIRVFTNERLPSVLVDMKSAYCAFCLAESPPRLEATSIMDIYAHCSMHGDLLRGDIVTAPVLYGFLLLATLGPQSTAPMPKINFSKEAVEMRATTVRKYVAAEWDKITSEEIALLEDDVKNGTICKASSAQMLARIRSEKKIPTPKVSG